MSKTKSQAGPPPPNGIHPRLSIPASPLTVPGILSPLMGPCPPGLQNLVMLNGLVIIQKIDLAEMFCKAYYEANNKYLMTDPYGTPITELSEDTNCCIRLCLRRDRCFTINWTDFNGNEIYIERSLPFCCDTVFSCCNSVKMTTSGGELLGKVQQMHGKICCCTAQFAVVNDSGETVMQILGPGCSCIHCGDVEFPVVTVDGTPIGCITKVWGGFCRETMTDADSFTISFPVNMDVRYKALLVAGALLIDFILFEN